MCECGRGRAHLCLGGWWLGTMLDRLVCSRIAAGRSTVLRCAQPCRGGAGAGRPDAQRPSPQTELTPPHPSTHNTQPTPPCPA